MKTRARQFAELFAGAISQAELTRRKSVEGRKERDGDNHRFELADRRWANEQLQSTEIGSLHVRPSRRRHHLRSIKRKRISVT